MSAFPFHILFVIPFLALDKRWGVQGLMILGSVLPDLFAISALWGVIDSAWVQNVFSLVPIALFVGWTIGYFSQEISIGGAFFILYGGALNHFTLDFLTHPTFSPFYPIPFTLTDAWGIPFTYFGYPEYDVITIVIAALLIFSISCFAIGKKLYCKSPLTCIQRL